MPFVPCFTHQIVIRKYRKWSLLFLTLLATLLLVSRQEGVRPTKIDNDFSELVIMAKRWCAKALKHDVTFNGDGDSINSRCLAMERLMELAKSNVARGNSGNEWQIKCEFWQQAHNLQFFTMALAMKKDFSVIHSNLYGLSTLLRPLLAALKSYLLKHLTRRYQENIEMASKSFNDKLLALLDPSEDECSLNVKGNRCFMSDYQKRIRGFGSAMIILADCIARTLEEGKKVVINVEDFWLMRHAFRAPLGCENMILSQDVGPSAKNHLDDSLLFLRRHIKPKFFPHPSAEVAWYNGIITDYMIRPEERILNRAKTRLSEWNLSDKEPFAGVHIRAGWDKQFESGSHPFEKYMTEVEEWFAVEELRRKQTLRRLVFIATDGSTALINKIQTKFPHFRLFYDKDVIMSAQNTLPNNTKFKNIWKTLRTLDDQHNYKNQTSIINMVLDLQTLLQADLFVGTMTSSFSRLVYKIRMGRDPLANYFNSVFIDTEFVFHRFTYPFSYVVVEDQHGSSENNSEQLNGLDSFDLQVGEQLKIYKDIINVSIIF